MRHSNQRDIIINNLRDRHDHPTANDIYQDVREVMPGISLGTVYRNLNQLADGGIILRIPQADSSDRFDGNIQPHYHVCCSKCGRVEDIDVTFPKSFISRIQREYGFEVDAGGTVIQGICRDCRAKKSE